MSFTSKDLTQLCPRRSRDLVLIAFVFLDHPPGFYDDVAEKLDKIAQRSTSIKKPRPTIQVSPGTTLNTRLQAWKTHTRHKQKIRSSLIPAGNKLSVKLDVW